jgi:hypothetical protein
MTKPHAKLKEVPGISSAEDARRDADARREYEAGEGIPSDEVRAWLHARLEGRDVPMPKSRKLR